MKERIRKAYQNKELICIQIKNNLADNYLVGTVEAWDKNGMILCNVDYRGIKTGYIYLGIEEILSVPEMPCYLKKIDILMKKQKEEKTDSDSFNGMDLKKAFLKWIYDKHELFWLRFEDEEIQGFICSFLESMVDIEAIDQITEEKNGHTLLLISYMNYFGININDNVSFSQCDSGLPKTSER